jgi:RluA family pseudouridine synthase
MARFGHGPFAGGQAAYSAAMARSPRKPDKGAVWKPGPSAKTVGLEAGSDLAHFIAEIAKGKLSVRAVRRALDQGSCRVNGKVESFGSRKLKRGDIVEFFIPATHARDHDFEARRVIHEDDDCIAYDKPPGLPVTPDDGGKKWNLRAVLEKKLGGLIIPVHRLDADTSGVVIFARNQKSARALEDAFRDHQVTKVYLALVRGHPRETGEYRSYLVKVADSKGLERWESGRGPGAKEAVTTWKLIERISTYASLVEVEPKTGRYHQIRIHFSEMGHPIYGDRAHGDRQDPIHVTRHLLHAWKATFKHPTTGKQMTLTTRFPDDFTAATKLLKKVK